MSSAPTNSSSSCALLSFSSHGVDLFKRTLSVLECHVVLRALKELCATTPGQETVQRRLLRPSTNNDNNYSIDCDHHWRTWRCGTNMLEFVESSLLPKKEEVNVDKGCGRNRSGSHEACCARCGGCCRCCGYHGRGIESTKEGANTFSHNEIKVNLVSGTSAI